MLETHRGTIDPDLLAEYGYEFFSFDTNDF